MEFQNQKTSDGSLAIQAGGNVTVNDYIQIREIVNDLFKLNFPELIKEASEKARENLEEYIAILIDKMTEQEKLKIQERLKQPDSQYLLNESIQSAARFGKNIDLNLLSRSVKNALLTDDELLLRIFTHASEIIPKLSRSQMQIILTVFYVHNLMFKDDVVNALFLEMLTQQCFAVFKEFVVSNESNKLYLVSLGVFSFNPFAGDSAISLFERKYPTKFQTELKPGIASGRMPVLKKILDFYDANNLVKYPITPVGSAIGFLITQQSIPDLSPNILKAL